MIRFARILLVTLLVAPQVTVAALPVEPTCQEERDCCEPEGVCEVACLQCACCAGRTPTLVTRPACPLRAAVAGAALATTAALPPQPEPHDILHVPRAG